MKNTKNMPVKLCRKCGAINSVLKDCCENCNSALSEPMKKKLATLESEIIYIETVFARKAAGQICFERGVDVAKLDKELDMIPALYGKAYYAMYVPNPPEGTHFPKLKLWKLRMRLKRLKRKQRRYMQ